MILPTSRDLSIAHSRVAWRVRESERQRLDLYLLRQLGWKSRAKVQKLIELGRVHVNGVVPKPASRTRRGDDIVIQLDVGGEALNPGDKPIPIPFWEDPYFLAIDKPPHRLVHPVGRATSGTIINEIHHRYRALNAHGRRPVRAKLCHRLDRETSGVLLIAKTDVARRALSDAFEHGRVRKRYLAIVEGVPSEDHFRIDAAIGEAIDRSRERGNRLARATADGKAARTDFEVLRRFHAHSLVACSPKTGRQNQIRIHLAVAGHPILGDVGYGSSPSDWPAMYSVTYPDRALLHSHTLTFEHPIWGLRQTLSAEPSSDFDLVLATCCGKPRPDDGAAS